MQGFGNTTKTMLLLAALTGLLVVTGNALGGRTGMVFAFVLAVAMNMGAWWFSDKIALMANGAREVSEAEAPELYRLVGQLAARANLPMPRVAIMDSPIPNAFATGRSPEKGVVAVTTGILQALNTDELSGVIAHELAHIKHRDTLISSVVATVAGAITLLADIARWTFFFGGFGGSSDDDDNGGGLLGGLLMLFLAPIAAMLIQLAISRSREFSADEGGAQIVGDPLPLARALEKLEAYSMRMPMTHMNPSMAHLYIVNPLNAEGLISLFRTHPLTTERVARLRAMAPSSLRAAVR